MFGRFMRISGVEARKVEVFERDSTVVVVCKGNKPTLGVEGEL
jgi:hypothetical protein